MNENSRIILVDDDPRMLRTLSMILKSNGYHVIEAATGKECLQLVRAGPPDLILLDVLLPDLSGIEVCRQIKSDPALTHSMVVLMSARLTNSEDRAEGLEGMADDYISLPISKRELLSRVRTMLRLKQTEEALRKRSDQLAERVKELNCLYNISTLTEQPNITAQEIFQKIVELIPPAGQYPEITGARIKLEDQTFTTESFSETVWRQSQTIIVRGEPAGVIEIFYLEEKRPQNQSPGQEENKLLKAVAERTGKIIEFLQAKKALRASEAKNRSILDALPDLMFRFSRQGEIIDFRANDPEDLVLDPDQVIGSNLADSIPPDVYAQFVERMDQTLDSGQMEIFEYRLPVKRGLQDFEARLVVSGPDEVLGIVRNITERKLAEQALRESEEKYRTLFETAEDAIFVANPDTGLLIDVNPKGEELLGRSRAEIIGRHQTSIHPLRESDKYSEKFRNATEEKGKLFQEVEVIHGDGRRIPVEISSGGVVKTAAGPLHFGIFRDITERKRAEVALRESEENFRQLVENIQEAFWIRDLATKQLIYLSPNFEKLWGQSVESEYEKPGSFLQAVHPADRTAVEQTFRQSFKRPIDIEYRLLRSDEMTRWVWVQTFLIWDESGRPGRQVGVAMDITERKRAEEQLRTALAEKDTLLQELYHRTKNNMYVISSMLALQADYIRDAQARDIFRQMENRIQSMALVHQKLYQSGNLSSIDLREYIEELADLLLQSYRVHPNRISLRREMDSVTVLIDSAIPCGLIVNELISNALQHAFPGEMRGEVTIGLRKNGDTIQLWVADNGVGTPPEFNFRRTDSLGLRTVLALGEKQLKGEVKFTGAGGVTCRLNFQDTLYRARI